MEYIGKTQGHGNSDLTPQGIEQAKELSEDIGKYSIDYIFSSDLGRAMQTAQILGDKLNIEVQKLRHLEKWDSSLGRPLIKEIQKDYSDIYATWRNEPHLVNIPEGETLKIIKERVDAFIKELNEKYDNKNIILVTHSITLRVMLLSFLESGMENIYRIKQDNTALNIVEFKDYGPVIVKMNDTSHIKIM